MLRGIHRTLPCADCHKGGNFAGLSPMCISCHRDDAMRAAGAGNTAVALHAGQTACTHCHNTLSFRQGLASRPSPRIGVPMTTLYFSLGLPDLAPVRGFSVGELAQRGRSAACAVRASCVPAASARPQVAGRLSLTGAVYAEHEPQIDLA